MKNKIINKILTSSALLLLSVLSANAQEFPKLEKYSGESLYSVKADFNVSGNWKGTEVQWDINKTYIEEIFEYELNLIQEGNRLTGTSFISDGQGNYSKMQLRGFVLGSKLHFEEYAIVEQVMKRPNSAWCLTAGELLIIQKDNKIFLSGSLEGYAPEPYICNETFVWFQPVHKEREEERKEEPLPVSPEAGKELLSAFLDSRNTMEVYPNPFKEEVTISFNPEISGIITLEIFDMSGKKISTLINAQMSAPLQQVKFKPSPQAQYAGVYLAVLHVVSADELKADAQIFTRQLVHVK